MLLNKIYIETIYQSHYTDTGPPNRTLALKWWTLIITREATGVDCSVFGQNRRGSNHGLSALGATFLSLGGLLHCSTVILLVT